MTKTLEEMKEVLNRKHVVAVVCGTHKEFEFFCREKIYQYESGDTEWEGVEFVYVSSPQHIAGIRISDILYYGTCYERKDFWKLNDILKTRLIR